MFTCNGKHQGLNTPHTHESVTDAKRCYGLLAVAAPVYTPPPPLVFGSRHNPNGPLSEPQFKFIRDLKGDTDHAKTLTYAQASDYISALRGRSIPSTSMPITGAAAMTTTPDPRLSMLEGLLPLVPEGYYAVGADPERAESLTFIRLSRPTKKQFAGAWKFQQVKGNAVGVRLEDYAVRWPSTRWSYYGGYQIDRAERCITELMMLVADHQTAAMLYSKHIGRCCRCNAVLTDERSRFYGIGPECEKHWPWHIEKVEAEKGVFH